MSGKLFNTIRDSIERYGIGSSEEVLVSHYRTIAIELFKKGVYSAKCQNYQIDMSYTQETLLGVMESKILYEFRLVQDEASVVRQICIKREVIAGLKLLGSDAPKMTCVNGDRMDVRPMHPAAAN